jgi:predicted MPP superfamily phosphohydrolase
VPGNHEYYRKGHCARWTSWLEERGINVLVNRGCRITRGAAALFLAGIDDLTEGTPDLERALDGRSADEPVVLLSHHPDAWVEARELGVDLQLSGHTHGGQIKLWGWSPLHHSRFGYNEGDFQDGSAHLVVGRGVGVTALPFRFAAPPEVPFLRLRVAT